MNNLFSYVSALKESDPLLPITAQRTADNSYTDDGVEISSSEVITEFANGVTLKQQIEFDSSEQPYKQVCAECWISYEVLFEPENVTVRPKKKSFINSCQESFWLKINKSQLST